MQCRACIPAQSIRLYHNVALEVPVNIDSKICEVCYLNFGRQRTWALPTQLLLFSCRAVQNKGNIDSTSPASTPRVSQPTASSYKGMHAHVRRRSCYAPPPSSPSLAFTRESLQQGPVQPPHSGMLLVYSFAHFSHRFKEFSTESRRVTDLHRFKASHS